MGRVFLYVVARDLGFAPNPFHGYCTLATCKPRTRNSAKVGDWVIGVGGTRLKAVGKCIFAMRVTEKLTFNEYWQDPRFYDKKPVRNGSHKMMLGDNIYYYNDIVSSWYQAPSHHSNPDGSLNVHNLNKDTGSNFVLVSSEFYYFGKSAPIIPSVILDNLGYKNRRDHDVYTTDEAQELINWVVNVDREALNMVMADPFDFELKNKHYSAHNNKIY